MEKFSQKLDEFTDPVARGYWATQQIRRIEDRGFSTRDIADLNDKRLFDQLMSKANAVVAGLSTSDAEDVQQYVMAEGYLRQMSVPAELVVPKVGEVTAKPVAYPESPKFGPRQWDDDAVEHLAHLCRQMEGRVNSLGLGVVELLGFNAAQTGFERWMLEC